MAVQGMADSRGKHFPACQSHSNPLFTTLVMLTGIVGSDVVQEPISSYQLWYVENKCDLPKFGNYLTLKHRISCR